MASQDKGHMPGGRESEQKGGQWQQGGQRSQANPKGGQMGEGGTSANDPRRQQDQSHRKDEHSGEHQR